MNESREKIYPCRLNYSVTAYSFFHLMEKRRGTKKKKKNDEGGEKKGKKISSTVPSRLTMTYVVPPRLTFLLLVLHLSLPRVRACVGNRKKLQPYKQLGTP